MGTFFCAWSQSPLSSVFFFFCCCCCCWCCCFINVLIMVTWWVEGGGDGCKRGPSGMTRGCSCCTVHLWLSLLTLVEKETASEHYSFFPLSEHVRVTGSHLWYHSVHLYSMDEHTHTDRQRHTHTHTHTQTGNIHLFHALVRNIENLLSSCCASFLLQD